MRNKEVIYIIKEAVQVYPPCITQILMLNDNGVKVTVVCGECSEYLLKIFQERNIKCHVIGNKRGSIPTLSKMFSYINFRRKSWGKIKVEINENSVLWFGTVDGAISLRGKYSKYKYVLNVLELYDKYPFYLKNLKLIVKEANTIIASEENRARIMKSWWRLNKIPSVMPNKSYSHPIQKRQIPYNNELKLAVSKIENKRVILYQGIISDDRDLSILAEALNQMNSKFTLVLLGQNLHNGVEKIKRIYANTLYLGYIPAPHHLVITSYADIGIANYDDSSLNNLFCAPNKIFEYSGFGIPTIGSDVPGLISTIGIYNAGKCVDFSKKDYICSALEEIEKNYEEYSANAIRFFESIDNEENFKKILQEIWIGE